MATFPPFSNELVELWNECVWDQTELLEFTKHFHAGDITEDLDATSDYKKAKHCKEFNFVQFFIQRFPDTSVGSCLSYRYRVRVEYYLEDSIPNQNKIQNFFEVLDNVIRAELGPRWKNCVDGYDIENNRWPEIRAFGRIDNKLIRVGSFSYIAEAFTTNN